MAVPDANEIATVASSERRRIQRDLRQVVLSGIALTVPMFITILVLGWAWGFVTDVLRPLVDVLLAVSPVAGMSVLLVEAIAAVLVLGVILGVGAMAQYGPDTNVGHRLDVVMEDLPGIGAIYTSVDRMSDVLLEGDTESFREVKLVEFPDSESFALGFLTADTPPVIERAAGGRTMETVFVPLAPNPVMGGHLLHVPRERIHDVDLSVEEGLETVVTTGVLLEEFDEDHST